MVWVVGLLRVLWGCGGGCGSLVLIICLGVGVVTVGGGFGVRISGLWAVTVVFGCFGLLGLLVCFLFAGF